MPIIGAARTEIIKPKIVSSYRLLLTNNQPMPPEQKTIELKEEGVKIIYRQGEPIACFKQNGTLKMYKLVEVGYGDIAEVFEPQASSTTN